MLKSVRTTSVFIAYKILLLSRMSDQAVHVPHKSEWITISTDEYESMQRTIEVLSDPDLMTQLGEGKRKNAPMKDFEELARELGI
ncbi:hypothetical protein Mhun_3219 [Methanospirillum hungatei JF-1]|uniref:Uncharacterized protein n=1 Tax=Methanospirillum hungatei JF-1 (strain ATCC 27890 / DSM 864 / NBRC 100397 / JF-1) TaxID=323259 RepID=Q2FRQ6_METHJ|nr:hypothetical protein Mhun_3219 [Methanospirillum hungatei JF-1]